MAIERKDRPIRTLVIGTVLASLLIPPVVFVVVALGSGLSVVETLMAVVEQFTSRKQNLFVVGALSLLPVVLMVLVIWLVRKFKHGSVDARTLTIGGAAGILAVDIWINFEYWPTFLPQMTYAGFPHGLEFVLGPFFFAPIAMVIGMVIAAVVTRRKSA
ncbi:MAG: hypothetical protein NXH95_20980 [Pseudomonadaceae bacterium]|nr:hypothetical protein [Pseudomonadaceae bacterium]